MTSRATTLLLVAGEASGDEHGARLVRAVRALDPTVRVLAVGGPAMASAGATCIHDMHELSVVGITEVATRLPAILRVLRRLGARLRSGEIDAFVPIDFPDFNFRLARSAHAARVPVAYFIAPQVWAWRRGRIAEMARWCEHIGVLFPFEVDVFRSAGIATTHVAHPLLETRDTPARDVRAELGADRERRLLALLPGSRLSEVERHLGVMQQAAAHLARERDLVVALARAPSIPREALDRLAPGLAVVEPPARDLVRAADLAITASGTATVEIALAGTPMVVIYKLSTLTWLVARRLVRVEHVAMANLLAGERLVPELLQGAATPEAIAAEAARILDAPAVAERIRAGYRRVRDSLAGGAPVDAFAAEVLRLARRSVPA